ncbi:MAG: glycosyltransferase [Candidatus Margulisiibacteriota bacterium]
MKNVKVSVILPTYNEKQNVLRLIEVIHAQLTENEHEIIVVDDNSPDGTYEAILALNLPYAKPILRTKNRGFANSIRCGLEKATGEVFVVMDSDFNHQPQYLPFMVQALSHYDCVAASRFVYGGGMDSRSRHLLSWIFNIFVRIITKGMVTDSLYGFFAIKKEVIQQCDYDAIFWGYGDYCIRLMFYLQKNGANILQFPALNGKRTTGEGNQKFIKVFLQYFYESLKLAYKERIKNRCTKK